MDIYIRDFCGYTKNGRYFKEIVQDKFLRENFYKVIDYFLPNKVSSKITLFDTSKTTPPYFDHAEEFICDASNVLGLPTQDIRVVIYHPYVEDISEKKSDVLKERIWSWAEDNNIHLDDVIIEDKSWYNKDTCLIALIEGVEV